MHFTIQLGGKENRSLYRSRPSLHRGSFYQGSIVCNFRGVQEYNAKLLTGGGGVAQQRFMRGVFTPRSNPSSFYIPSRYHF